MPGLPDFILVHVATPVSYEEPAGAWIEGEPGPAGGGEVELGKPFPCVLFMPGPGGDQSNPYRSKVVKTPQLMYDPARPDGSPIVVLNENELLIEAPELAPWTGAQTARWLMVGDPQPFGPPGTVFGLLATVRQVKD